MSHSVTLELPDALYQKLKLRSQQTNRSVEEELLTAFALDMPILPIVATDELPAYSEVINFLGSGPSAEEIVQFQLSNEAQARAKLLVSKEKDGTLLPSETKELDFYIDLGDFLGVLRAKAQLQLLQK